MVQINEIAENLAQERLSTNEGFMNIRDELRHYQGRLNDFDTTLTRAAFGEETDTCPITGLTQIEEIQEALSENVSAIAALQGHVIPRVDALENTVEHTVDLTVYNLHRHNVADQERILKALCLTVQTLPKQLAISRLGGRITNLDERMHSLAGTFTDHEELTQVRQEQLRTELLIRLDPPVL